MKPKVLKSLEPFIVPIDEIELDPKNARAHPKRNLETIKRSLKKFGQRKPVVLQARRGKKPIARAGNGMVIAAKELGWTEIAAVTVAEGDRQAEAFAIADNRSSELSLWNTDVLGDLMKALRADDWNLEDVGFNQRELETMFGTTGSPGEDDIPDPPAMPVTRTGDLWILGDHQLLCGDAGNPKDVDQLLAEAPIHLVYTDPPYNVHVEPRSKNALACGRSVTSFTPSKNSKWKKKLGASAPTSRMRAKDRPIENDSVTNEKFMELLRLWFGQLARALEPGRACYIWGGFRNIANYPIALTGSGFYFSQTIIWIKEWPVIGRKDFMLNHEWCYYGWREGAAHKFFGPKNATDVWSVKKVTPQKMVHLTEKPVELARRAMDYSSQPGENVLDLFGGSGSTLIAAQETGRRAFLMEMDPLYCDIIISRFEKFTGMKARLTRANGATVATIRKRRKVPA